MLFGVVTPVLTFLIAESGSTPLLVEWQSGEWNDYIAILLGGAPARPFYPFVLWAMGSLIVLVANPVLMAKQRIVRMGVYTGIAIGMQFILILSGGIGGVEGLIIGAAIILAVFMVAAATILLPALDQATMGRERVECAEPC